MWLRLFQYEQLTAYAEASPLSDEVVKKPYRSRRRVPVPVGVLGRRDVVQVERSLNFTQAAIELHESELNDSAAEAGLKVFGRNGLVSECHGEKC